MFKKTIAIPYPTFLITKRFGTLVLTACNYYLSSPDNMSPQYISGISAMIFSTTFISSITVCIVSLNTFYDI